MLHNHEGMLLVEWPTCKNMVLDMMFTFLQKLSWTGTISNWKTAMARSRLIAKANWPMFSSPSTLPRSLKVSSLGGICARVNKLFRITLTKGTNVLTTSLHPGIVRTQIWRNDFKNINVYSILAVLTYPLILIGMKNCEEGAQTTLHCALDDEEVPNRNGEYFS